VLREREREGSQKGKFSRMNELRQNDAVYYKDDVLVDDSDLSSLNLCFFFLIKSALVSLSVLIFFLVSEEITKFTSFIACQDCYVIL